MGLLDLISHDIECLGKSTERVLLIHRQRNVEVSACDALGKSGQLVKRFHDRLFQIDHICDDDHCLYGGDDKDRDGDRPLVLLDPILCVIMEKHFADDFISLLYIQDRVVVFDGLVDAGGDIVRILVKKFPARVDQGIVASREIFIVLAEVFFDDLDAVVDRDGVLLNIPRTVQENTGDHTFEDKGQNDEDQEALLSHALSSITQLRLICRLL